MNVTTEQIAALARLAELQAIASNRAQWPELGGTDAYTAEEQAEVDRLTALVESA